MEVKKFVLEALTENGVVEVAVISAWPFASVVVAPQPKSMVALDAGSQLNSFTSELNCQTEIVVVAPS
ncbi:MAG: hypothetical protein COX91_00055 [Candidatus Nealsonbacteria bacterium CG_4_10_14_0_2_um_filter_39_15]|uniref:Uncharacterized protein n=1 Tax=Candidatus Nealsonbacteria bacterium CG_4_10_14_0_2_um_filter_39_15 TaxID=1974681 RepID=A0A2M7UWW9_9BACT|nr:MAG: hypothetical protein COX91_00055 [Candidatus Nealsonbacteria bacterium CG_4_10_14_0_2_um_filter_39_15]